MKQNIELQGFKQLNSQTQDEQIIELNYTSSYNSQSQQSQHQTQQQYLQQTRPDLLGLKAIAILIIVYHNMFPQLLPGGFVGIDIFLVISGYLVTQNILNQMNNNNNDNNNNDNRKFSYVQYYIQKIHKYCPSLIILFITVIIFGYLQLNAQQLQQLSKQLISSTFFTQNIQLINNDNHKGYFHKDSQNNVFMNLWYIAVEVQFVIIWPIWVNFGRKIMNKNSMFVVILIMTITSFLFNILKIQQNDNKYSFYSLFCRFWQLSLGSLISLISGIKTININIYTDILSIFSFSSLIIFILFYNFPKQHYFSYYTTLFATFLTFLIISSSRQSFINKYILSNNLIKLIGKISYSLYLWNWLLLVFIRMIYPNGTKSIFTKTQIIIFIAIIISILSYFFIEKPIMNNKSIKSTCLLILFILIINVLSYNIYLYPESYSYYEQHKFQYQFQMIPEQKDYYYSSNDKKLINTSKNKNRINITKQKLKISLKSYHIQLFNQVLPTSKYYDEQVKNNADFLEILNQHMNTQNNNNNKNNTLFIIGDSHAQQFRPRFLKLYEQLKQKNNLLNFPTIVSLTKCNTAFASCYSYYHVALNYVKKYKPKRVFLNSRWVAWFKYGKGNDNNSNNNNNKDKQINTFKSCQYRFRHPWQQTYQQVQKSFTQLSQQLKQIINLGTQVYIGTISPQGQSFDPRNMVDTYGNILPHIPPVKLSQFKQQNKQLIQLFQTKMKSAGVKLIDFAEHQCWEDKCDVLTPKGYALYIDDNHYRYVYSKYWASSVDFLTEFQ